MKRRSCCLLFASWILVAAAVAQGDPKVIEKIVDEGKNHSKVWDYLTHLSEDVGPRLTGSTRMMEANAWTRDVFRSLGLHNAHLFKWGELPVRFDRGPSSAGMVKPVEREFEFTTRSWSAGTECALRGRVFKMPKTLDAVEELGDDLEGAWILSEPQQRRRRRKLTDEEKAARKLRERIVAKLYDAGIAGQIAGASSELVITSGARGWRELDYAELPSEVSITVRRSDYDAMNSRLADGEEVEVEADLQNHFVDGPFGMYDTIAEIPGSEWPEQVVIISGHLDSWDGPGSTGTQDNGTGSSVTLEAARILMAAGVKPRRTIRFCLWSGEEQGLLGSRGYVESLTPEELAGISAVFVDDGGTNYEGGVSCIASMEPMLSAATAAVGEAFPKMPVNIHVRERMSRFGGSDHASFNRKGVPGFFWDESGSGGREGKNYRYIHHTQHDTMRYPVKEYLVQSATCSAITAYNLAMADTLLPRELPESDESVAESDEPEKPFNVTLGPLSGQWKLSVAEQEATITLEMSTDARLRGTFSSALGEGKIKSGTYDKSTGVAKFNYDSQMGLIKFEAKVSGDEMTGTINVEDVFSREFTGKRASAAAADSAEGARR